MQRDTSAINATFARRARHRRHFRDIGDTSATCARFRRTFPRLSAIGRLTSQCVFPCPTKFPGMHFSIYHLFQHRTMIIFTGYTLLHFFTSLYTLHTGPITTIHQLPSPHFYHVLNNTLQALVVVSSSGHIRISVRILMSLSRYHSHTAFAQFRFSTRNFPALRAPIAPLFPRFRLITRFAHSP